MKLGIINKTLKLVNLSAGKNFPRHSTRAAKKLFKDKEVKVIEIGTLYGDNAKNICENLNVYAMWLVDPYESFNSYFEQEPDKTQEKLSNSERIAQKKMQKFDNIHWVKEYSDEAVESTPDEVDFVYIDGDHSYEQAKKDMINYWGKIKKGGMMGGHDITNDHDNYGVAKAFVEFCSEYKLKPYVSRTDWWVIKE